jgi:tetratricopeptide (TPR) repeat protein
MAIVAAMSPRMRIAAVVGALALAAAVAVVGIATLGGTDGSAGTRQPRTGHPPLSLDLGVRTDAEAQALRQAATLYGKKRYAAAERIFARHRSVEARIGEAFAAWPDGSLADVERLGSANPGSGVVQLNLGLARFWAARGDAAAAWRRAVERDPDTPYAVTAGTLLHPDFARGLPIFVPAEPFPPGIAALSPPQQLRTLRARAGRSATDALRYGVALQRLGRPVSAERVYARAARKAPDDAEAQTAAAVGRFSKDDPSRAFSRLGPLTRRFPKQPTVRFHLGLLLLWSGQVEEARRQLRLARAADPSSPMAREAQRLLTGIAHVGTK